MRTRTLSCPTCGTMQVFRPLDDEERAALRAEHGDRYYVDWYWRCTAQGCLSYYRHLRMSDGGLLPERFRAEEAAGPE
ncbi:hypothetical protein ACIF8T_01455 [Streptomyces sp. NPDC085946]|uniref:hypothetical protein n=1 Tax=Streptomyces sp. NPDC085946 TaxID=3365744 RepID=UPI0037D769BA